MVPKTTAVEYEGRRERAEQLGARLGEEAWSGAAGGQQRACLVLTGAGASGMGRWLLVRRAADAGELAYHLAYGPAGTTSAELLRVCDVRWQIEEGFAQAKGELGLDQYEVRGWDAWHRFVTLCLLAHAYLAVLHLHTRAPGAATAGPADEPDLLPLTVPEVRRLVLALAGGAEQRTFRLGWSRWRRRHQAAAARSRAARHGRGRMPPPQAVPGAVLTDAEWVLVQPLLPPQRPPAGRPRHDHRAVLSGIVWVIRRRDSWRAVPKECGKWAMVYKRYQLWRAEGRWQRIATALGLEDREVAL